MLPLNPTIATQLFPGRSLMSVCLLTVTPGTLICLMTNNNFSSETVFQQIAMRHDAMGIGIGQVVIMHGIDRF